MKPLVYVAGPISGDPFGCVRQAVDAFDRIRDAGSVPFLPQLSVLHAMLVEVPYETWLEYDFDVIRRCDALLRLSGTSPGADREIVFASGLGLPVFFDSPSLTDLRAWAEGWRQDQAV